jgi:FixJ family two-component response regulator
VNNVWILDADEDNRSMALEALASAGVRAVAFSSPHALIAHTRRRPPAAAVIDARTARGTERDIRRAIASRIVVVTTWSDVQPWLDLGVTRFLLKPFDIPALLEHVGGRSDRSRRGRGVVKARLRRAYRRAV